jgi:hypothetical protein
LGSLFCGNKKKEGNIMADGNEGLGWRAALPTDLQNHDLITPHKEVKELAADYVKVRGTAAELETKYAEAGNKITDYEGKLKNALFIPAADAPAEKFQEFNGKIDGYVKEKILKDFIPRPKENATEEEKTAFYKALGRPESKDEYKFEKVTLPAGAEKVYDPTIEPWFKDVAFQIGLSKEQAGFLYKSYAESFVNRFNQAKVAAEQTMQAGVEQLKADWGKKLDENILVAARAVERFGGPNFKKYLDETGKGNDPRFVKTFYEIGKAIVDDKLVLGRPQSSTEAREPGILKYPSMEKSPA